MSGPNPVDHPELYDVIVLAGIQSPGVATVPPVARDQGWEAQQPKGSDGGETIHNGEKLLEFDVDFFLWKEDGVDHYAAWEEFEKLFKKPIAKKDAKALDIYHPQLDGLGIKSVVVRSFTKPKPDGKGGATVKVKFLEYKPPKPKAAGKPKGSAANAGKGADGTPGNKPPDPNQAKKDTVAALTAENDSL